MEQRQIVGIDISKLKFDVCTIFGEKSRKKIFTNNISGFKELAIELLSLFCQKCLMPETLKMLSSTLHLQ